MCGPEPRQIPPSARERPEHSSEAVGRIGMVRGPAGPAGFGFSLTRSTDYDINCLK